MFVKFKSFLSYQIPNLKNMIYLLRYIDFFCTKIYHVIIVRVFSSVSFMTNPNFVLYYFKSIFSQHRKLDVGPNVYVFILAKAFFLTAMVFSVTMK